MKYNIQVITDVQYYIFPCVEYRYCILCLVIYRYRTLLFPTQVLFKDRRGEKTRVQRAVLPQCHEASSGET